MEGTVGEETVKARVVHPVAFRILGLGDFVPGQEVELRKEDLARYRGVFRAIEEKKEGKKK